ncbi:MAG: penicillin acylase family protein, partial [Ardenticatenaceae bacterium]|nr:penicillin acylase family protein [Ardenticatenaceae bacterium]
GNDPAQWQWGRLHRVCFAHALGQLRPLDAVFNHGPLPIGGDIDTVAQTSIRADAPYDNNAISISSRHIVNLGDLSQGQMIIAPGQSGQLGSPHYGDLLPLWRTGAYVPVAWTEAQITAVCHHKLVLKPGSVGRGA